MTNIDFWWPRRSKTKRRYCSFGLLSWGNSQQHKPCQAEAAEVALDFRLLIAEIRTCERRSSGTRSQPRNCHVNCSGSSWYPNRIYAYYRVQARVKPTIRIQVLSHECIGSTCTYIYIYIFFFFSCQAWTILWWACRDQEDHQRRLWSPMSIAKTF